jgi:phosphoribosylglycinamide formyltransferase-1
MGKVSVAVFASGRGSNFKSILDEIKAGRCNAEIKVLVTNNPEAPAIETAKKNAIPVEIFDKDAYPSREEMDSAIKEKLDSYGIDLIVLAGYMLLIKGKTLLDSYKIINIHPALLPSFPGVDAQKQAFEHGVKISGVTIHFVDAGLDNGPIIYQEAVDISDCKNADEAAAKILKAEHSAYAKVVDSFSKGHYETLGRRTMFVPDD